MFFDDVMVSYVLIYYQEYLIVIINFVDDIVFIYRFNVGFIAIVMLSFSFLMLERRCWIVWGGLTFFYLYIGYGWEIWGYDCGFSKLL
jgi:hypothetical protein